MDSGSGFCREQRSRSPFFREFDGAAEWHCRQQQGYSHLDHSVMHHQMHSQMFMEKIEPSSSGADQFLRPPPPHPPCSCYSCSMARHSSRPPQPDPWCYKPQEYMGKPCVAAEGSSTGMQSPCFSIRTPLRKDARMIPSDSPTDRGWMWYGPGMRSTQSSQNQINLHKWFLVRLTDSEVSPVAVGGFVSCGHDMELVKTGPIVDRIDKVKLRTRDGEDVRLMGCIDEEATIAHGFSGFVTQFFFTGFPCTWRRIIGSDAINERCLPDNTDKASTPVADLKVQSKNTAAEAFQDACPETPVATIPGVKPVSEEEVLLGCTKEVIHTVDASASDRCKETLDESVAEDRAQTAPVPKRAQARKRVTNKLPTRCSKRLKDKDSQESDGSNDSRGKGDGDQETGRKGDADTDREEVVKEAVLVDNVAAPSSIPTPSGEKVPDVPTPSSMLEPVAPVAETEDNNVARISDIPEPEPLVEVTAEVAAPEDALAAPSRAPPSTNRKRARRAVSRGSRKRKTSARKVVEVAPSVASEEAVEVASTVPSDENVEAEQGALETVPGTSTDHENQQEANAQVTETELTGNIDEVVIKEEETERHTEEEIEDSDIKINKRSNSKRASRARKPARKKKESENKPSIPVVQIDSDDQADQLEPKTESKPVNQRGKRSALPPPLPASRVAKSEVIEAYGLKTSRSGRLLVPPLAYWRNQTLALDKDGGIIAIMDGFAEPPSDTGIFNFKPPTEKKRLQQKLCAAAATDSPVPLRRSSSDRGKKKVRGSV